MNVEKIIAEGESLKAEFKSWVNIKSFKERIEIAVKELVAFANAKGGTLYLGIEDDGEVTGCSVYDCQKILEAIYDKTRPNMYVDIDEIEYKGKVILALTVEKDNITYATSAGTYYKRLGKNSKPYYPSNGSDVYNSIENGDFSAKIIIDSSIDDIDKLAVYKLKEDLKLRDRKSTLPQLEDETFLRDLGLIVDYNNEVKLTIAGMLFVGKESAIARTLPQAEVIYLHYSEGNLEEYDARIDMKQSIVSILDRLTQKVIDQNKIINVQVGLFRIEIYDYPEDVFQEALLNALSHRDYSSLGAVYVKHYPDKIVIENPGTFLDGITPENIITHQSVARNKLIAETLQRLRYVQRTGQGVDIIYKEMASMGKPYPEYMVYDDAVALTLQNTVEDVEYVRFIVKEQNTQQQNFSLREMMIIRYVYENGKIRLAKAKSVSQGLEEEVKKALKKLCKIGVLEISGHDYMFTQRVYEELGNKTAYVKDKALDYIKAKEMIKEYVRINGSINIKEIGALCNCTKDRARRIIEKMRNENILILEGRGKKTSYKLK